MNAYQTLHRRAEVEYGIKKSRFIGVAAPVSTAEDALELLDGIKKEHRGASHHCFAYVIGQNKGIIRYSDDGEPSGTAGRPILEVISAKDAVDCAVVVTRYFGGILLGTGGLARAYTQAAALAMDAAGLSAMHETARWRLHVPWPLWDRVDYALKSLPVIAENVEYAEDVKLTLLCRTQDEEQSMETLVKTTDGKIQTHREELTFFHPWGA